MREQKNGRRRRRIGEKITLVVRSNGEGEGPL
jgi:hypothetical protein